MLKCEDLEEVREIIESIRDLLNKIEHLAENTLPNNTCPICGEKSNIHVVCEKCYNDPKS